jgi:hypothetical protein
MNEKRIEYIRVRRGKKFHLPAKEDDTRTACGILLEWGDLSAVVKSGTIPSPACVTYRPYAVNGFPVARMRMYRQVDVVCRNERLRKASEQ